MTFDKTSNFSIASYVFADLDLAQLANSDANSIDKAASAYAVAARTNTEQNTLDSMHT